MKSQTTKKYVHLEFEVFHKLDITIPEYWFLDTVYFLSRDGWCWKSLQSFAIDMKMSKRGVAIMRDRLIEKGLLKKNRRGHLKTGVLYNSVLHVDRNVYNSVHKSYNSVPLSVELSATKNNNEINKEYIYKINKNSTDSLKGKGYLKAREIRSKLQAKVSM